MALFPVTSNPSWPQAVILDNFEWPYHRNGSFDPLIYSAYRAVIFAIAQLSCSLYVYPSATSLYRRKFNAVEELKRAIISDWQKLSRFIDSSSCVLRRTAVDIAAISLALKLD